MTLIEKASANDQQAPQSNIVANGAEPKSFELDFDALRAQGLYTPEDTASRPAHELRAIKRRLLRQIGFLRETGERQAFRQKTRQRNLLLVTSSRAGEGKSFTALNLALSLALEDGIETLLVDGDIHRPKVASRLGLEESAGLTDLIAAQSVDANAYCYRAAQGPLTVLPEGQAVDRPADLFATQACQSLMGALSSASRDRLVIIDAPPVLAAAEAVLLAKHVDEVLFVVEAGRTLQQSIAASIDELLDVNQNISLVLNRCLLAGGGSAYDAYEYYDSRRNSGRLAKSTGLERAQPQKEPAEEAAPQNASVSDAKEG